MGSSAAAMGRRANCPLGGLELEPRRLSDEELERRFTDVQRHAQAVEAEKLSLLAEIDRRATHRRDGHLSTRDWLTDQFGVSRSAAKADVRTAQALSAMPEVHEALADGEVSSSAVKVLTAAWEANPRAFERSEPALVEAAKERPTDELRRVVQEWSQAVDADRALERAERARERRRLSVCPTETGMVRVDGELDPEGGEEVMTAIRAIVDAEVRSGETDWRTAVQRNADALVHLARCYLDRSDRPVVGGERPHLTVTVDMDVLRGLKEGSAELEEAGPVHPETARRLACDASVRRVVVGPSSEPLDVGRATRVVPPAMRRALVLRDRGCAFPRCGRPPRWCDAHHVVAWERGGETKLSNLVLLCRKHHHLVHEGGFTVQMLDGRPVFRRPDGSVLREDRAPP